MLTSNNHPSNPVTLKDTGYVEERLWSPILKVNMRPEGGAKKSKGSTRKIGRHFRKMMNDQSLTMPSTKYVRSGGPNRCAARKARNLARQARLNNAERRILHLDRRMDRRILKAASEYAKRLEE